MKDYSKLRKIYIIDINGNMRAVYVNPYEDEKGKSLFGKVLDKLRIFFGFKEKVPEEIVKKKLLSEYKKYNIRERYNVSYDEFYLHVAEYLANPKKWDQFLEAAKKGKPFKKPPLQIINRVGAKGPRIRRYRYKFELMKEIQKLYGGNRNEGTTGETTEIPEGIEPIGEDISVRMGEHQPYLRDGIIVRRPYDTQRPKNNYIPEDLRRHLKAHQADFVNLAIEKYNEGSKSILNMDDTGTGKTRQALALAEIYNRNKADGNKKVVIVTENTKIINENYMREAREMGIKIKHCKNEEDIKSAAPDEILIVTYNKIDIMMGVHPSLIVYDESHNLKNKTSQKTIFGTQVIKESEKVALFSATPADSEEHFHYIATAFGMNYNRLMRELGYKPITYKGTSESETNILGGKVQRTISMYEPYVGPRELAARLSEFYRQLTKQGLAVRREKSKSMVRVKNIIIEMDKEMLDKLNAMKQEMQAAIEKDPDNKGLITAQYYQRMRSYLEIEKAKQVLQLIPSQLKGNKQIVIYAARVNDMYSDDGSEDAPGTKYGTLEYISRELEKMGIKHVKLYGSPPNAEQLAKKFQNGEVKVLLTTHQSGGTGIELDDKTGNAPRIVYSITPSFSASTEMQKIGRFDRINTKSVTQFMHVVARNEVDIWNSKIVQNKLKTLNAIVARTDWDDKIHLNGEEQRAYIDMNYLYGNARTHIQVVDHPITSKTEYSRYLPRPESAASDELYDYKVKLPDVQLLLGDQHDNKKLSEVYKEDKDYVIKLLKACDYSYEKAVKAQKTEDIFYNVAMKAIFVLDDDIVIKAIVMRY